MEARESNYFAFPNFKNLHLSQSIFQSSKFFLPSLFLSLTTQGNVNSCKSMFCFILSFKKNLLNTI